MKTYTYIFFVFSLFLFSCGKSKEKVVVKEEKAITRSEQAKDTIPQVANQEKTEEIEEGSLNDIRFGDWEETDWHNNDYFRFLRKCLDACYDGIENEDTEILKRYELPLKSKFAIFRAEPFLLGGMFITFIFLDKPESLYQTAVYSNVDEKRKIVTGYSLYSLRKLKEPSPLTKEEILEIVKENPILQLW